MYQIDSIIASPYYLLELATAVQTQITLQHIISGGAPIFASDAEKILNTFHKATLKVAYGSTEAEPISYCKADEIVKHKDAFGLFSGKPVESILLKIITPKHLPQTTEKELNRLELPVNKIGEIIVSGDAVNESYLDNPQAIAENKIITEQRNLASNGRISGYLNEKGQLFLTGRSLR
ncbi:MAG: AMP-binding protein, partial [Richelia sp. RM2_1_2]|nr:AMP-binding protein [Richelia sp. RM2_1_2]